jgi:hypothetical protein
MTCLALPVSKKRSQQRIMLTASHVTSRRGMLAFALDNALLNEEADGISSG